MREISDQNILNKFTIDFCNTMEDIGIKYIKVSGFVAISHGRSRGTEDINIMIEKLSFETFLRMHAALAKNNFECLYPKDTKNIFNELELHRSNIRYTKIGEELPNMEVKFTKDTLDEKQLETRIKLPFTDLDIYFPKIEEAIAFKEEYLKSDKDMEDAKYLRIIYKKTLDENYIENYKKLINKVKQ
ncbi:MAG: hypothetical protein ACI9P9_000746 [Patescibacteria group bacterium]|jgi:hypothetical protein